MSAPAGGPVGGYLWLILRVRAGRVWARNAVAVANAAFFSLYTPETGRWLADATAYRLAVKAARGRR